MNKNQRHLFNKREPRNPWLFEKEKKMRILIIGTYLPRQCGIATFTHDLYQSLIKNKQQVDILAIQNGTEGHFPKEVVHTIEQQNKQAYSDAAKWINEQHYDACILQHEFGIFAGDAGNYILELTKELQVPLITNLHTVLENPNPNEYTVVRELAKYSRKITVMTQRAINMLAEVYEIPAEQLHLIPHGIPEFKISAQEAKEYLGLEDKTVMLSFGLLGRGKGFEVAIDAVSKINSDNFVYIILGATHPNVLLQEGESYKNGLMQQAADLGLNGKVIFVNKYASESLLHTYLKACDLYVTPYPNANQMSSGTLTFALGAGAAVLSTPYWYAKDLLADGRGCLFDFNNPDSLAECINNLLGNPKTMMDYRKKALKFGKSMSWSNVGKKQIKLIQTITTTKSVKKSVVKELNSIKNIIQPINIKLLGQKSAINH